MNDGDWICVDANCGNINFSRRLVCYRCNKERPESTKQSKKKLGTEIGKCAAEKSRGLFNPDDWQCNKCANVNWARRVTCNVCNAPKFGDVEARTGYGGGYNERGVVEYRKREPSSEDEFDEFGRRKKKRRMDDSPEEVGVTEGPVHKKVPPNLQRERIREFQLRKPSTEYSHLSSNAMPWTKVSGSLSDGSVCEVPSYSQKNHENSGRQYSYTDYVKSDMIQSQEPVIQNGNPNRKRQTSSGDVENTGSSGYETGSKQVKCNISTYVSPKMVKPNYVAPKIFDSEREDVCQESNLSDLSKYTIREKVKLAALTVAYNNCNMARFKFEKEFNKKAPDIKTMFLLRQRLLQTGCLVDSHVHQKSKSCISSSALQDRSINNHTTQTVKKLLPNPEEIILDLENDEMIHILHDKDERSRLILPVATRSQSVETILIENVEKKVNNSSKFLQDNQSDTINTWSKHFESRSQSCESLDKHNSDNIEVIQKIETRTNNPLSVTYKNRKMLDSDSDSLSDCSQETDFLSRHYRKNRKPKFKTKKRNEAITQVSQPVESNQASNAIKGYNTVKSSVLPLVTGNIYSPKLANMNVRKPYKHVPVETDGYGSEYVPTKLGCLTKNNYQAFKDNVMKKGYWAKGNGKSTQKKVEVLSDQPINKQDLEIILSKNNTKSSVQHTASKPFSTPNLNASYNFNQSNWISASPTSIIPLNKQSISNHSNVVFDVVQSNSSSKNKSILEIFGSEKDNDSNEIEIKNNSTSTVKPYEVKWDEEDDALYRTDTDETTPNSQQGMIENSGKCLPSSISPRIPLLQAVPETIQEKREELFSFLSQSRESQVPVLSSPVKKFKNHNECPVILDDLYNTSTRLPHEIELESSFNNSDCCSTPQKKFDYKGKPLPSNKSINLPGLQKPSPKISSINTSPKSKIEACVANMLGDETDNEVSNVQPTKYDLANLLTGINTNTLLLALQNLNQLTQNSVDSVSSEKDMNPSQTQEDCVNDVEVVEETINLTNDEDWEKESLNEIERQLERMDGNTGDTPFLSDIFDPGPVVQPETSKKFNINLKTDLKNDEKSQPTDNLPVIGNFKSFALPKPLILNRLKLNSQKKTNAKKKKKKPSTSQGGDLVEEDDEESGDEADLSKYDLWGSEDEQGSSSKPDKTEATKEKGDLPEVVTTNLDKNGISNSPDKKSKSRSRSSSSSSSTSSSSSSSQSSANAPKNKFDDFNLNSERECSPKGSRPSKSPRSRSISRRRSGDSRESRDSRNRDSKSREDRSRDRDRRDKSRSDRRDKHSSHHNRPRHR